MTVTAGQIIDYVDRIAAYANPRRVILFGSYASGFPTADSDIDLLITKTRWADSPLTVAGKIRIALGVPFSMDLIARSEADIQRRLQFNDPFVQEIIEKGITLYAADDARVGSQGRIRLRRRLRSASLTQEVAPR